jgi:alkaline phosphatase
MHCLARLIALALLLNGAPALARNVILIIGDGMDDQQITIARNYLKGAHGRLLLDQMPVRSAVQVLTVDETGQPVYVADSANSASAMATGQVTSRGRIATTAGSDQPIETIIEQAEAAGLRTGLVATSSITDATPAAFVAHVSMRFCENPETIRGATIGRTTLPACENWMRENGGPGSISEQIAASGVDVALGGGRKHFDLPAENDTRTVREQAEANGFTVIDTADQLATAPGEKLLGLFSPSTMPVRLRGEGGRSAESPRPSWANQVHRYLGSVEYPDPMRCEANPDFEGMPSLADMTATAIRRLENDKGFFLMVESASIDKQSHERKPCGSIGELEQLEEVLAAALEYAERRPDTLVLVTADHSQAAQLVPGTSLFAPYGVPVYTPGQLARIVTDEGVILAVNYATNSFVYEEHTGANVPLFANTAGRHIPTMVTQPQIYEIMRDYLFGTAAAGDSENE